MNRRFALFLLLTVLLSSAVLAQTGTSRVIGNALDNNGAVVPGAKITITNEGTNASVTTTTGSSGAYAFDSLQLGSYTISAEAQGFKKFVSKGNLLTAGVPLTVNAALEVGGANDTVEVSGSFERVQTSTSGNFGATVDNRTLTDLPLGLDASSGGRNPLVFVRLQPGVTTGANTGGGSHVNGARDRAFNYTLDGIDINESSAGGSEFSPLRTNPDSLQEFRVITSNATADRGRSSGAQVELVTKSGTNQFHGNLFYFHRNSALAANEWQNPLLNAKKPVLRQHQYGGDVGGPIFKDKTFFFFNYQGQSQVIPVQVTRTVYTPSAKAGIFRYIVGTFVDSAGATQPRRNNPFGTSTNGGPVIDASGNPSFPNCSATVTTNCIASYNIVGNDPRRLGIDPTIQSRVLDLFPNPNQYTGGDGLNTAQYVFSEGRLDPQRDFVFKIDHSFNTRHNVSVRYAWGKQNTINDSVNGGLPAFPGLPPKVNTTRDPRNLAVNYRWQISPTLINELVVGGNHFTFNFINPSAGAQPYSIVTINPTDPLDFTAGNLRTLNTYQVVDNLSWSKGAHLIKGGINFRYQQHRDIRGSLGSQNANRLVNIVSAGGIPIQTVNPACLNNGTGVNAAGQELFCLPTLAAGATLGINANDRPRLQSTIDDLLGRVSSVTQGFTA
ncbi:MAG: carboxypeptidase-like regulatory domain-containing protein, partial [Acidobacteriota bacterium]